MCWKNSNKITALKMVEEKCLSALYIGDEIKEITLPGRDMSSTYICREIKNI